MDAPRFEFLYEITIELEPPQLVGDTPQGNRQIFYVVSGRFEGPRMKGEMLPGGGDWFLLRPDGAGELDVRATLRTDDGALIYLTYRGVVTEVSTIFEKLAQGQEMPRDQYYFYTSPYFQTASEKYAWLNKVVAVGIGSVIPGGVAYRVFALV